MLKVHQAFSNAHIERVLNLPQRTSSRWKKDGASAAAVTLMKCVMTFPWILHVAEQKFEAVFARKTLIHEATDILLSSARAEGWMPYWEENKNANKFSISFVQGSFVHEGKAQLAMPSIKLAEPPVFYSPETEEQKKVA